MCFLRLVSNFQIGESRIQFKEIALKYYDASLMDKMARPGAGQLSWPSPSLRPSDLPVDDDQALALEPHGLQPAAANAPLPPEHVVARILSFLPLRDVAAAAAVSRDLYAATRQESLWQSVGHAAGVVTPSTSTHTAHSWRTAVRLAVTAPLAWRRGEYTAAQRLARSAGWARNVFTACAVTSDGGTVVAGSSSGGLHAYRVVAPRTAGGAPADRLYLESESVVKTLHTSPAGVWLQCL